MHNPNLTSYIILSSFLNLKCANTSLLLNMRCFELPKWYKCQKHSLYHFTLLENYKQTNKTQLHHQILPLACLKLKSNWDILSQIIYVPGSLTSREISDVRVASRRKDSVHYQSVETLHKWKKKFSRVGNLVSMEYIPVALEWYNVFHLLSTTWNVKFYINVMLPKNTSFSD